MLLGEFGGYGRTAGALHSLGLHLVWCRKYRRPVLVGGVADRLRVLVHQRAVGRVSKATIRQYIAEQTTRPEKGRP